MDYLTLDFPLIKLSGQESPALNWTVRQAVEGVQIFGGIGSGKTSGSGKTLASKYLKAGFGGLVLTVKPDEKELWESYCQEAERSDDLLIIDPKGSNYFNFIDYESHDGSITENIVQVLKTVIKASEEKSGGHSDPFWETSLDMIIFNVIDLCKLAYGKISVHKMFDIVQSLPRDKSDILDTNVESVFREAFGLARNNVYAQVSTLEATVSIIDIQEKKENGSYNEWLEENIPDIRILTFIDQFFFQSFLNLHEKTRSIIEFSFSGFLFRLLRDPIYSLFCQHSSTLTPEDCFKGKIILLNLPVKLYHKIGRDSQILFKYIWQRAMEKRQIVPDSLPVFLWADEAQHFIHEHDVDCQSTARSSRIATVYITQNLPNYLINMGGVRSAERVKSFLGNLSTKIFHANVDTDTNNYASELIGDGVFIEKTKNETISGQFSSGQARTLRFDKLVRPENFAKLKAGGNANDNIIEAYIHLQSTLLKNGKSYSKIQFKQ